MKRFRDDASHEILPVPMPPSETSHIPANLMHGNALIVAPTGSGKSFLLSNIITRPTFGYVKQYDRIIVMSPTIYTDELWSSLITTPAGRHIEIVPQYDESFITALLNSQDADVERMKAEKKNRRKKGSGANRMYEVLATTPATDFESAIANMQLGNKEESDEPPFKASKVLIILDDIVDSLKSSNSQSVMDRLFFRGRHSLITCFVAVQSYKKTPRSMRINVNNIILFKVNESELAKIAEEVAQEPKDEFTAIVRFATRDKYSFLFVNTRAPYEERYRLRFQDYIQLKK
jgi:hypothetical protein